MKSRLFGAIVDGVGLAAGRDLFEKAKQKLAEELGEEEPTDPAEAAALEKKRAAAAAQAEKERLAQARKAEKERVAADKARRAEAVRKEKQVDAELAALKRKLGR